MKKQTLEEIMRLISEEKMDEEDVRNVMIVIRKQDVVVGDIIVCRDELVDIASVHFIDKMSDDETEARACEALEAMDIDGSIDSASETFWDALISDIDYVARDFVG